jgi:hypothetical protein
MLGGIDLDGDLDAIAKSAASAAPQSRGGSGAASDELIDTDLSALVESVKVLSASARGAPRAARQSMR